MPRRLLAIASLVALTAGLVAADRAREKTPITIEQLRDEYTLVGRLGVPLHQLATVDVRYVISDSTGKVVQTFVEVTAVDGKPLQKPLRFGHPFDLARRDAWQAQEGRSYRVRVYESAGFFGTPRTASDELPHRGANVQSRSPAPGFVPFGDGTEVETKLVIVRVLEEAVAAEQK